MTALTIRCLNIHHIVIDTFKMDASRKPSCKGGSRCAHSPNTCMPQALRG